MQLWRGERALSQHPRHFLQVQPGQPTYHQRPRRQPSVPDCAAASGRLISALRVARILFFVSSK
jgi:hypothetical protein